MFQIPITEDNRTVGKQHISYNILIDHLRSYRILKIA